MSSGVTGAGGVTSASDVAVDSSVAVNSGVACDGGVADVDEVTGAGHVAGAGCIISCTCGGIYNRICRRISGFIGRCQRACRTGIPHHGRQGLFNPGIDFINLIVSKYYMNPAVNQSCRGYRGNTLNTFISGITLFQEMTKIRRCPDLPQRPKPPLRVSYRDSVLNDRCALFEAYTP